MRLRHRDGRDLVARAQAVAVADGVLLVFDEAAGQASMQDNERLQERIAELESLSATDPLTGAWNRVQLERMVDVEISRAMRSGRRVTLVIARHRPLQAGQRRHGHLAGDAVLTEFVGRVRERMRDTDSLFRWGGDEFVVLATSVGYRGGAALAEGLRRTIAAAPFAEVGPITASLGVTEYMEGESARAGSSEPTRRSMRRNPRVETGSTSTGREARTFMRTGPARECCGSTGWKPTSAATR